MRIKILCNLAVIGILYIGFTGVAGQQEVPKLRWMGTIAREGPYSFPQKLTLDRFGNLYILDPALSNIFLIPLSTGHTQPSPLCSPRTPVRVSDLSVDRSGGIWILAASGSSIIKLDKNCKVQKSFDSKHPALAIQVNTAGEIVVLTSSGDALFDLFD